MNFYNQVDNAVDKSRDTNIRKWKFSSSKFKYIFIQLAHQCIHSSRTNSHTTISNLTMGLEPKLILFKLALTGTRKKGGGE